MAFEEDFKTALEEMIDKENDDYEEIQYSDELYVHVWSHDNGKGHFEIDVVVPHDAVDEAVSVDDSVLSPEIPGVDEFHDTIERLLKEVTGNEYDIVFQLADVVANGAWERDGSMYSTMELTAY